MIGALRLTHFYTSPSAARAIAASAALEAVDGIDTSSLRVVESVGEALDDRTCRFLFEKPGRRRSAVVDTHWQTEMGSIVATAAKLSQQGSRCSALRSFCSTRRPMRSALLCIASPWPGLTNSCINGHERFVQVCIITGTRYFSSGDLALNCDGYFKIMSRSDDQLCVNGHRVGPAAVETAVIEHPKVREGAIVGVSHVLSGQAIVASRCRM
jgi:acetyl-CoA synthetase